MKQQFDGTLSADCVSCFSWGENPSFDVLLFLLLYYTAQCGPATCQSVKTRSRNRFYSGQQSAESTGTKRAGCGVCKNELGFGNDRVVVSDRNWDDTWHAGVAAVRVLSPKSFVSVGVAYESSPVKDQYRTVDFPVDEQWKLSASYAWKHNDNLAFSLGATLAFIGDAALEQTAQRVTVRGDYDTNMLAILGGTLRYDF